MFDLPTTPKPPEKGRALIGTDAHGAPVILATDSVVIFGCCEYICTGAEDVGLCAIKECLTPGLYLWEGEGRWEDTGSPWEPGEPEMVWRGKLRPVKPEEVAELYAMTPPEE